MAQHAALERQALDQLRRGDLEGARGTLGLLARLRPSDSALRRRLEQVEGLIARREDAKARMKAEPLRYAHAYIKAGRLEEGLRLLRAALAKEPENARLEELARQVARRLRADRAERAGSDAAGGLERRAAEDTLRAQAAARREKRPSSVGSSAPVTETAGPSSTDDLSGTEAAPPASGEVDGRESAPAWASAPLANSGEVDGRESPPTRASARLANGALEESHLEPTVTETKPASTPEGRLREVLERVRSRRRAASRWLSEPTSLERR